MTVPGARGAVLDPLSSERVRGPIERATDLTGVLVLKHEALFLLSDPFGDIQPDRRGLGLYAGDTRVLSTYQLVVNGERPVVLRTGTGGSYASTLQLTNPDFRRNPDDKTDPEIVLRRQSLGIVRERLLSDGFRERISIHNFTLHAEGCRLAFRIGADYADIFEVRGVVRPERGRYRPPEVGPDRLLFGYRGLDGLERRTAVAFSEPLRVIYAEGDIAALELAWEIPPGAVRCLEVTVWTGDGSDPRGVDAPPLLNEDQPAAVHRAWSASSASVSTNAPFTERALRRAMADLRLLVSPGPDPGERFICAGVPWFSCLFGRDSLISALQLLPVRPQVAVETLTLLARLQATAVDDWRDAQPGKILHELRSGELARGGEIPHTPYYGSVDATPLWLILFSETHLWTGDDALVERLWPNALAALHWIEEHGDPDGDSFVEYERRSSRGLLNQGWKDSADANRTRDGRLARGPLALVEVQAYVYAARLGLARLARRRGDEAFAAEQEARAAQLRERFDDAFWMPDVGTYALALDESKHQVDAIGSNPGHALWCGIVKPERAAAVVGSLTGPELWSGWGIRTLSSAMAGYNPIGYHIGSVWPHDNAIAAEGLARYGFREETGRIAGALLEATAYFRDSRLPELFCGFSREDSAYPVPYPVACTPQAWAAGSLFQLVAAMLGMRPDAAARRLDLTAPTLPPWLPELRFENLRVGDAVVDLLFHGSNGSTAVEVLRRNGELAIVVRV